MIKISDKLEYYIMANRIDKEYPQFYKVLWRFSDLRGFPAKYKYILITDLENNPKLFNAIQKREKKIDKGFPSQYDGAFAILHATVKEYFIERKYQRELKKSKVKVYTEEEREEYIKNNLEKEID